MTTPSAEDQIQFLNHLQRLLSEGGFTASYKFALLLALADLSVELQPDEESTAIFHIDDIAAKFIEYYWRHTAPYPQPNRTMIRRLFQNSNPGKEATILTLVAEMQKETGGSIAKARMMPKLWNSYKRKVARVVEVMPLTKLQTFGRETMCFLYENPDVRTYRGFVQLKPGVAFFLRRFHILIHSLVQEAWVRYIRGLNANQPLLGQALDLHEFLFGTERNDLSVVKTLLHDVQDGRCFYCSERIIGGRGDVDHFIPWSRYTVDLGHNFVLAHSACNNSKREFLADVPHLAKWVSRNRDLDNRLLTLFQQANVVHDLNASIHITRWAYEQAELSGASVWLRKDTLNPLTSNWKRVLISG